MTASPKTVAITGASSGLGAALALQYAVPGRTLFLCARRSDGLGRVATNCTGQGAEVHISSVDVRSTEAITEWVDRIEQAYKIDLMIVNAGLFGGRPTPDIFEAPDVVEALIETNLTGAIHCAYAAASRMVERGGGHIALVSSLAAKEPSRDAPSYSASKAGLSAFGAALREDLADHGVRVTLIHPGHIRSAQTNQQDGSLPLILSAEDAARTIFVGLEGNKSEISFPLMARLWVGLGNMLPWRIRAGLNRSNRFTVRNLAHGFSASSASTERNGAGEPSSTQDKGKRGS